MKILLILLFLPCFVSAQSLAELKKENGYQGKAFGSKPEAFTGLQLYKTDKEGTTRHFIRSADTETFGGIVPDVVYYGFYKDKFFSVSIQVKGPEKSNLLFKALTDKYGEPVPRETGGYAWDTEKVTLTFTTDNKTKDGSVLIISNPILNQKEIEAPTY